MTAGMFWPPGTHLSCSCDGTLTSLWQITTPASCMCLGTGSTPGSKNQHVVQSGQSEHCPHSAMAQPRHKKCLGRKHGPWDLELQDDEAGAVAAILQPRGKSLSKHREEKEPRDNAGETWSC